MEQVEEQKYNIKIDNFEGPLDLLCHLLEKNKFSIYDIPIAEITDQYIDYLFSMQALDMEIASEFTVMASNLLYIKSRHLLPKPKEEVEEEEEDPEELLMKRLIAYKRAKKLAEVLKANEDVWKHAYYKEHDFIETEPLVEPFKFSPYHISRRYLSILERNKMASKVLPEKMKQILEIEKVSLRSKMRDVINLVKKKVKTTFSDMIGGKDKSNIEVVTSFLAILELSKMKQVTISQKKQFDEIVIENIAGEEDKTNE